MTINVASLISFLVTPVIRTEVSYFFAFALPSLMLLMSILVFLYPRKQYKNVPPAGSLLAKLWPAIVYQIQLLEVTFLSKIRFLDGPESS